MRKYYTRACNFYHGKAAKNLIQSKKAFPLNGKKDIAFDKIEIFIREKGKIKSNLIHCKDVKKLKKNIKKIVKQDIKKIISKRKNFLKHINFSKPSIMGVLNLTPDSFSDGGEYLKVGQAIEHAHYMVSCGAALVDIGGESTKPSAAPISSSVERKRVLPIVKALVEDGVQVSIDTYHPDTMEEASALGASVINDISGFTAYPNSKQVGAASGRALVLVHSLPLETERGAVFDGEVAIEIYENLFEQIKAMELLGVSRGRIVVDPGLGFEKSHKSNFSALRWMGILHGLGCQIMIGASRKFGRMQKGQSPKDRLPGSIAASLYGTEQGAHFLRVHDVAEIQQALGVWRSIT